MFAALVGALIVTAGLLTGWVYLILCAEGLARPGLLPTLIFTAIVLIAAVRELRK